jgi:Flp pilus assembly pilin Flp
MLVEALRRLAAGLTALIPAKNRQRAQAMVEYGLIICLVVLIVLITLILLGNQVKNAYCNIGGAVNQLGG